MPSGSTPCLNLAQQIVWLVNIGPVNPLTVFFICDGTCDTYIVGRTI